MLQTTGVIRRIIFGLCIRAGLLSIGMLRQYQPLRKLRHISILNSAPSPELHAVSLPFMFFSMMFFEMKRPIPVPVSGPFVEKYGSNILSMICDGIPPALVIQAQQECCVKVHHSRAVESPLP